MYACAITTLLVICILNFLPVNFINGQHNGHSIKLATGSTKVVQAPTDSKMSSLVKGLEKKGTDVGVDIAKSGGKAAAKGALDLATDESRKVLVKFTNKTKQKWSKPKLFLSSGATEGVLPLTIDNDGEIEYEVHKKKWTFSGIAGVIVYQWKADGKSYYMAVMFRKPMVSRNMWNAVIYEGETEANQELFRALTQQRAELPPMRGDSNYTDREFGPYTLQGAMSSTGNAVHITVSCTSDLDE